MKTGCIFDIERSSTTDGPGIRTVVFFKGCNFRCWWCHNPEGYSSEPQLLFDPKLCCGCGECLRVCEEHVHQIIDGAHTLDFARCSRCFRCVKVCPALALKRGGEFYTSEQLVKEILIDKGYYDTSGGGVTFSGGEPMMQASFLEECLMKCREEGISCAMETNLCFPFEMYERILPYLDCLMMDIKTMDGKRHRDAVGSDNQTVLNNFTKLKDERWKELPIIVRTPVVPGFNDSEDDIRQIAEFVNGHPNLQYYELLAYHPLGAEKRIMLGMDPVVSEIPGKGKMSELARAAAKILPIVKVNGILHE